MSFVFGMALGVSGLLLALSVFPGFLPAFSSLALLFAPFWLPASCVGLVVFLDLFNTIPDIRRVPFHRRRWVRFASLVLVVNLVLLWGDVPRRLAFALSRPNFAPWVQARVGVHREEARLDRRLGLYRVDVLASDPRGGVYFQTRSGKDSPLGSVMTYGFACKPNATGTPFGDRDYAVSHLLGDWYAFQAGEGESNRRGR